MTVWTAERRKLLKELLADKKAKHSASKIAEIINRQTKGTFTRNAVIGATRRLRIPMHPKEGRVRKPKKVRPPKPQIIKETVTPVVPQGVTFLNIPIVNLQNHHCRALHRIDNVVYYCGQPNVEGYSFCSYHKGLYYVKPRERVRAPRYA